MRGARLEVNELTIDGVITDIASGAVFLKADVLVEAGERGTLSVGKVTAIPVRASFSRTASADEEAGMVLAFEPFDAESELRVLETLLALTEPAS